MTTTKPDTTTTTGTDRIEKRAVLRAPRGRVWRALTDSAEFGAWFGVKFEGQFAVGATVRGRLTIPGYDHLTLEVVVERMETERLFAYRWHPYAVDTKADYSREPMTLVEFRLADAEGAEGGAEGGVAGATSLVIVESGFDRLPAARRAEAFRMNDGGWTQQLKNIARHVANQ